MLEKEKMLVASIFSFSHYVFKRVLSQSRLKKLNSLPNVKILDQSKLKEFADDKRIVTQRFKFVLERVENIWGKRRKRCLPVFSSFLTMF